MLTLDRALTSGNYSPAVVAASLKLFNAGMVRPDPEYPSVFWVGSAAERGREYRVELYQHFASCSCRHGQNAGSQATCKHTLTAMTYRKQHGLETAEDEYKRPDLPAYPRHFLDGLEAGADLPDAPF